MRNLNRRDTNMNQTISFRFDSDILPNAKMPPKQLNKMTMHSARTMHELLGLFIGKKSRTILPTKRASIYMQFAFHPATMRTITIKLN